MQEKIKFRLRTKNLRHVISHAVTSIDYDGKAKIIEIKFKDGEIYHYRDATRKEWNQMIEFAKKGEGLGTYINQTFKEPYKKGEREYYKVNVLPGS